MNKQMTANQDQQLLQLAARGMAWAAGAAGAYLRQRGVDPDSDTLSQMLSDVLSAGSGDFAIEQAKHYFKAGRPQFATAVALTLMAGFGLVAARHYSGEERGQ